MLLPYAQVGVTNGTLRALSGLTGLRELHLPDAFRVTNSGLEYLSTLTGIQSKISTLYYMPCIVAFSTCAEVTKEDE